MIQTSTSQDKHRHAAEVLQVHRLLTRESKAYREMAHSLTDQQRRQFAAQLAENVRRQS